MSQADIHVRMTLVDRLTPELHRARYRFLTPISRKIPPRGTMAWQFMELQVRFRQLGRALVRGVPGASAVPWSEVGRVWGRRLELLGWAYLIVGGVVTVLLLTGAIR